jgi:DNA-binding transcriptional regulator YiaG
MSDLYASGGIDNTTMLEFDESCLTSVQELSAAEITAIREHESVSMGASTKTFLEKQGKGKIFFLFIAVFYNF